MWLIISRKGAWIEKRGEGSGRSEGWLVSYCAIAPELGDKHSPWKAVHSHVVLNAGAFEDGWHS
jgi:hypothetical protein